MRYRARAAAAVASRLLARRGRTDGGRPPGRRAGHRMDRLGWRRAAPVLMTGPVTKSFVGEFDPKEYG